MRRLNNKSRMRGDFHVRFGESQRGRFPLATRRNIYVKTERSGQRVFESISAFLEKRLKLKVNREKSAVDRP